ncbi:MAG: two pore domain potassium channel family protein [Flavobacteriales bacterium]|nr:two pore domain potassium channel family protein [Flavobacteriales bacterium]
MTKERRDRPNELIVDASIRSRFKISLYLAIFALTILVTVGTVVYRNLEGWSWADSFYFSVTTLTTVGYGDLAPSPGASRVFTALFIVSGVAVSLAAMTIVGRNYLEIIEREILLERWRLRPKDKKDNTGPEA